MSRNNMTYSQLDEMTKKNFAEIEILKDTIKEVSSFLEELKNESH